VAGFLFCWWDDQAEIWSTCRIGDAMSVALYV
jgi:hypothetical protein